jgi:hypothetical protein
MSLSAPRARVFSAYRQLFRARSKLFRGDTVALRESRTAIRQQFVQNAGAATSGSHFEGLLQMADEAADMLLRGIVQGRLNEKSGHYGTNESCLQRAIMRNLFSLVRSCLTLRSFFQKSSLSRSTWWKTCPTWSPLRKRPCRGCRSPWCKRRRATPEQPAVGRTRAPNRPRNPNC